MKHRICLSLLLFFTCNVHLMSQTHQNTQNKQTSNADVALKFMNAYINFINTRPEQKATDKWLKTNPLVTDKFKTTYKKIEDDARKADPVLGLDFDPILNAQDYPDRGFEISTYDEASGYVTLVGIDLEKFKVTVKIVFQNNKWMVDGAGIINIPEDKQAKS